METAHRAGRFRIIRKRPSHLPRSATHPLDRRSPLTQTVKRKAAGLATWTPIEELKNDLQADGFCMEDFYATESAFLSACFTYNLLILYQHASAPKQRRAGFKRPAALCAAVFIGGALLGTRSRTPVLYIAQSWDGLEKHKPLLDNISQWPGATSPKLPPDPPGNEQTGGEPEEKYCAA